jgi:hypothetical protein
VTPGQITKLSNLAEYVIDPFHSFSQALTTIHISSNSTNGTQEEITTSESTRE